MTDWTSADLAAIDHDRELRVAARRPEGTLRPSTIVWHVVVDGNLYIRSVRGSDGAWYKAAHRAGNGSIAVGGVHSEVTFTPDATHNEAIDRAYHAKYGNGSPYGPSPAGPPQQRPCGSIRGKPRWWGTGVEPSGRELQGPRPLLRTSTVHVGLTPRISGRRSRP